jgi:trimethylguanosine synthase
LESHQNLSRSNSAYIWLKHELKFPSKIAAHIAESAPKEKTVIVDAFAGVGGNAIALARSGRWERVFAIEKDPKTMKCAKHNAEIYGVANKIFWLTGDCFESISRFAGSKNVMIFASPPWGGSYPLQQSFSMSSGLTRTGTSYGEDDIFDLTKMEPYNLDMLYKSFIKYSNELVLYLPRNSDLNQIARYVPEGKKLEVAHYAIMGASKVGHPF